MQLNGSWYQYMNKQTSNRIVTKLMLIICSQWPSSAIPTLFITISSFPKWLLAKFNVAARKEARLQFIDAYIYGTVQLIDTYIYGI